MKILVSLLTFALLVIGSSHLTRSESQTSLLLPAEEHLRNLKQLTFGGKTAEAYFSSDGKQLIFQSTRDGRGCDQIYTMNVDGSDLKMISNGDGRTTCSYFFPGAKRIRSAVASARQVEGAGPSVFPSSAAASSRAFHSASRQEASTPAPQ